MKFSVVIAINNRTDELVRALESIRGLQVAEPWEVLNVDYNSTDNKKDVVLKTAETLPVPLRYFQETQQSRSAALNTGIKAAQGEIIAITDDDVRIERNWLTNAGRALQQFGCDYLGGKALPIWSASVRIGYLKRSIHWAVIALLRF